MGRQGAKSGIRLSDGAYERAKLTMNDVGLEHPGCTWETFAAEVLKRWRVELCTLVLEHGRHA